MSAKSTKRSKVSVTKVISSDEEMDSDLDQMNDELADNLDADESDSDAKDLDQKESDLTAANSAWADAINKVLTVNPKKKRKSVILSKAKKDRDLKRKSDDQTQEIEIVKSDGTVVKSYDHKNKKLKTNGETTTPKKKSGKLSKHEWEVMHKLKPKEDDKERERLLCSIATKGVVQLFNAVKEQQKTIETKIKEVGISETKRDKMLSQFNKNRFLDKLKEMDKKTKDKKNESETKSTEQKWKVLKNDFMMGAKMKDWDKESDSDRDDN